MEADVRSTIAVREAEPVATHEIRGGGGLRLHAREWGDPDGPALLFIHGWSQSDLCWTKQVSGELADAVSDRHLRPPGHGLSEKPLGPEHYARRTALGRRRRGGDRADRSRAAGRRRVVLRRLHRHRLPARLRRRGDRGDQSGRRGRDPEAAGFDHIGPGLLENAQDVCALRPRDEHRRDPALPARVHRAGSTRTMDHGAVLEHGRAAGGPRRAVRARDRRQRRPREPVRPRARHATGATTRSSCPRWRSTCSRLRDGRGVVVRRRRAHAVLGGARRFDRELDEFRRAFSARVEPRAWS